MAKRKGHTELWLFKLTFYRQRKSTSQGRPHGQAGKGGPQGGGSLPTLKRLEDRYPWNYSPQSCLLLKIILENTTNLYQGLLCAEGY